MMLTTLSRKTIAAAAVIAPLCALVVVPWLIFPFGTGKALLVRLVALAALPLWAIVLLRDPAARPRRHPLLLAIALYGAVLALAAILGVDPARSFWGTDERMVGLLTLFSLFAIAGMAYAAFRSDRAWRDFLFWFVAVSAVNSLWGIAERAFPDFWSDYRSGIRVIGLLGNPIFYSAYCLGAGFVAISLLPLVRPLWARGLLLTSAAASILGLLFSGTRGTALGLMLGGLVAAVYASVHAADRRIRVVVLGSVAAAIIAVAVLTLSVPVNGYHPYLEPFVRLRSVFTSVDQTGRQRLLLWRVALEGIRARPLLGWGPENFGTLFDRNFEPALLRFTLRETFADRAHNEFLGIAADAGLLGLLAYLLTQAAFIWTIIRARRRGTPLLTCAALLGFLAAMDVHLFFSFETVPTLLTELLLAAWVIHFTSERASEGRTLGVEARVAAPAVAVACVALLAAGVVRPTFAFAAMSRANRADPAKTGAWLAALRRSADMREPYRYAMRLRAMRAIFTAVGDGRVPPDGAAAALDYGIATARAAVFDQPREYASHFNLGNLLLLSAMAGRTDQFAEAESAFLRAADLSPRRQSTFLQLGNLKIVSGDAAGSVGYFRRAVEFDPDVGEPHWHLGLGLNKAGDPASASSEFARALDLQFQPKLRNEMREAASVFFGQGLFDRVVQVYERAVDQYPDAADLYAELAAAYAAAGRPDDARVAVRRAVELDPSFAEEAESFLQTLPASGQGE